MCPWFYIAEKRCNSTVQISLSISSLHFAYSSGRATLSYRRYLVSFVKWVDIFKTPLCLSGTYPWLNETWLPLLVLPVFLRARRIWRCVVPSYRCVLGKAGNFLWLKLFVSSTFGIVLHAGFSDAWWGLWCYLVVLMQHSSTRHTWSTSQSLNPKYFQTTDDDSFLETNVCPSPSSCCSATLFAQSSWMTAWVNMVICRCCAVRAKPWTSAKTHFKACLKTKHWLASSKLPKRAWWVTQGKKYNLTVTCDLVDLSLD